MTPTRVAIQVGAATVRVAAAEADGEPWLLAELPAPAPDVAELLAGFVGPAPEELLLVHPASWPASRAAGWARTCAALAGRVHTVPAPLAAAGPGARAVLDVGHGGAEATRLGTGGGVLACRTSPAGGARLDDLVHALLQARGDPRPGDARRVREALSLLPSVDLGGARLTAGELRAATAATLGAAVGALREVLASDPVPVLLVGGVARAPLLAELVDEAGIADAAVAVRPDSAAVLGALALPRASPDVAGPRVSPPEAAPRRLPALPPRRPRPLRAASLACAGAALVAALVAAGTLLPSTPPAEAVPAGVLVQYGYRLDVPAGWEHTGGLPERRRVVLTPVAAPDGSDLVAVERSPLGYDAGAEPQRARAELRAEFDAAVAGGSALGGYEPDARVAGREVTRYLQADPGGSSVEWFVVLDGDSQLSVGCRHTPSGTAAVRRACAVVVGSLRRQ